MSLENFLFSSAIELDINKKKMNNLIVDATKEKIFFEDFPAPKLDIFPSSIISERITGYLDLIRPNEVFIPFFNDL